MALTAVTFTMTFNGAMTLDTEGASDIGAFIVANYDPLHLAQTASFEGITVTSTADVPNPVT